MKIPLKESIPKDINNKYSKKSGCSTNEHPPGK
jgi:hypothetical protein